MKEKIFKKSQKQQLIKKSLKPTNPIVYVRSFALGFHKSFAELQLDN